MSGPEGPLSVGQSFGSRYHIIKTLGVGGMGAVYQAWDAELGVAVALKVIRPEVMLDPTAAGEVERRFKRELLLARQVTHKNVVRIHDLGEIDGIKYITMPYVEGSDLSTILKEQEAVPIERTIVIARGVVAGLKAAHDAGVVHRDLKPANIMIEEETGDALIMDFGIARSAGGPAAASNPKPGVDLRRSALTAGQTMAGTIVGTVEYMAPEQARGADVDHRADLYAFGLILYDMLTGRKRAGHDRSAIDELQRRMLEPPPPLNTIRDDVPAPLEHIVARCVAPDVEARYATTADLVADFDRLDEHGHLRPIPKRFSKKFIAAALAIVTTALVGTWQLARTRVPPEPPPPTSVLITDFDNRTGDPVFEGSLEQALTTAMENASFITVFPRGDAQRLAAELGGTGKLDEAAARLISRREGIKVILAGSIARVGSGYRVSVRAFDPAVEQAQSQLLAETSESAETRNDVSGAIVKVANHLRTTLGDTTPESARLAEAEPISTGSLEALQAYTRGQALADQNNNRGALTQFEEAVRLDPNFGRAYASMAVMYTNLKEEARAKEAYEKALKLVDRMTERERYRTLGTYYLNVARNYEKAIETYQTLIQRFPADDSGHGNLGLAYVYSGDIPRAIQETRKVLEIYPNQWIQRWNLSVYSMYAGDFDTAIAEAERVVKQSPTSESTYLPISESKLARGDFAGALALYDRLERSGESGAVLARFARADLELYRGRPREALKLLRASIEVDEGAGLEGTILARSYLAAAEAYLTLGDLRQSLTAARRAIQLSDHESIQVPVALLFVKAERYDEAAGIARRLENTLQTHATAYAKLISAEIEVSHGQYAPAVEMFRDSIKRRDTWFARLLLGKLYVETEHFPEALAELELAVKRRGEVTDVFVYDTPTIRYLPPAYYWLGRAQQALGITDARQNYQQYLSLRGGADPVDPLAADAQKRIATKP